MTLNSTIITAAFREANFAGQGETLTATEQTEGLALLQSLVDSFFGLVIGSKPRPWYVPHPFNTAPEQVNYPAAPGPIEQINAQDVAYPPTNCRIFLRNTTTQTIYLQYQPEDGAMMEIVDAGFTADVTLNGNGMFIGSSGVAYTDTLTPAFGGGSRFPKRTYVFRGDIASWVPTSNLVYGEEFPFPSTLDDFFITALTMRLAPRYGNTVNEMTFMRYKDMTVFARGMYRQSAEAIFAGPERADQSFENRGFFGDPDSGRL